MSMEGFAASWWGPQDARKSEKMLEKVLHSDMVACFSLVIIFVLQIALDSDVMEKKV